MLRGGLVINGVVTAGNGAYTCILELWRTDDSQDATVSSPPPASGMSRPAASPPSAPKPAPAPKPAATSRPPDSVKTNPATGSVTKTWDKPPTGQTTIRNAHLAGKVHPKTGVPFDKDGYPDFRAAGVVKKEVKIKFSGDAQKDFRTAYKEAGITEKLKDYTWHHHQDGETMQLIPTDIHKLTGHSGGFAGSK